MNTYLLTAVLITIFVAMLDVLIIDGKNGKLVKCIISLISVACFITPLLSILSNNDFEVEFYNKEFTNYLIETEKQTVESEILGTLTSTNYNVVSVNSVVENANDIISTKKVEIILNCNGINCKEDHINITKEIEVLILKNVFESKSGVEIIVKYQNTN